MDMQELWEKAIDGTEIIRPRVQGLKSSEETKLPYIFLAKSSVNLGDTIVRKGEVLVEKPYIIMPSNLPYFEGFEFEDDLDMDEDILVNFLLVRGVKFPSMKYNNKTSSLDLFEGDLSKAIGIFSDKLQSEENVDTGLITGPEECWQFSVLIFICSQIAKSVNSDIRRILDDMQKRGL